MQYYKLFLLTSDETVVKLFGGDRIMMAIATPMLGEPRFSYGYHVNVEAVSQSDAEKIVQSWFADDRFPAGICALFESNSPHIKSGSHAVTRNNGQVTTLMNAVPGAKRNLKTGTRPVIFRMH